MESVWWAFKQLYEAGKIYEGEKVLLYCVRDATPISKAEVAMDNSYQDVTDPSVYVKFKLTDRDAYLLAWTTTPWTLPANTAAAINPKLKYVEVETGGQTFVMAKELVESVMKDERHNVVEHTIKRTFNGEELVGLSYEPLFENRGNNAHKVWGADYVNLEEGTGVVHLAPAYGEEDYLLAKEKKFPLYQNIDDNGFYTDGEWKGKYVWDVNKPIAKALHERGDIWKVDYIRHSYPHCHRCGTKLMYRAHPSWFMDISGQRQDMLRENSGVNWFPEHIKHGRSEKTIESAPDWNLSRDRFWATAMPVWKGKDKTGKEHVKVIGSYAELKDLSGVELEDYHRPWIDDVTFTIDGVEYERIDKVMDCWFESGSMPFAQFHYPFENTKKFEQNFPGDFIVEYVPQVRAWFYYLSAVGTGLFGKIPFKTALVHGTLAGDDGRKMSKSFGNYTDPGGLVDKYSADAYRFLLMSSPLLNGEDFALHDKDVGDTARKLSMIWNMYDFFTLYADVDKWDSGRAAGELPQDPTPDLENPLDLWVISRVHQLSEEVDAHMQRYDLPNALKPILPFIDDASNWYVRRSRKRFWKSDNDSDKLAAYRTLHYVLVRLSLIMAPFTPFLSEELYRQLVGGESVHLLDWPEAGHVNELLIRDMAGLREAITAGLAKRADAGIKVRQPLSKAVITLTEPLLAEHEAFFADIAKEELNVKVASFAKGKAAKVTLDTKLTPELKREGLVREVIRHVQSARKQAGLQVDDRIHLRLITEDDELMAVLKDDKLTEVIKHETLAKSLAREVEDGYSTTVKIEDAGLAIRLAKA
jgi:isoleucyl-tRNA synthetase